MKKLAHIITILAFAANTFAASADIACGGRISKTTGGYEITYFITDHLGSTRVITGSNGEIKEQNDYYPFGMRHENSNLMTSTNRYLFSGKELQTTGGINYMDFGSRMYDDFLGRWFAIDPRAEDYYPLSPYAYCGNNPVIYRDYNGELFGLDDLIAGVIGGVVNIVSNAIQGNIHSIGDGFAAFGAGFAAGSLATYGPAGWAAGGAILGATNSWLAGNTGWDIVRDAVLGGATSIAGGYAGQWASNHIGNIALNGLKVSSQSIIGGTISGVISGTVSGAATGTLYGLIFDPEHIWKYTLNGAYNGGFTGGIVGGFNGYYYASTHNKNIWTGKDLTIRSESSYTVYVGTDRVTGETKYVGITKREVEVRWAEHLNSGTEKSTLKYEKVETGLTKTEARVIEQNYINKYGMQKNGGILYNKYNSINPRYWDIIGVEY